MVTLIQGRSLSSPDVTITSTNGDGAKYYSGRANKARAMAQRAVDPDIRVIHLQMAEHYEEKVSQLTAGTRSVRLVTRA